MMRDERTPLRLGMLGLFLLGCSGGGEGKLDLATPDVGQDLARPDQAPDQKPAVDLATGPHLTSAHDGWKEAVCSSCHNGIKAKNPHTAESYKSADCVGCHGLNGARHHDHAASGNCLGCHAAHEPGYAVPKDCATCHFHPANPGGT